MHMECEIMDRDFFVTKCLLCLCGKLTKIYMNALL